MNSQTASLAKIYVPGMFLGFVAAYLVWVRKLPVINQAIIFLILSITLPPMSSEYTLLQIIPAFGIFFIWLSESQVGGLDVPDYWIFGVLTSLAFIGAPASYLSGTSVGFGGQLKLISLIGLVAFCLKFPMYSSKLYPGLLDQISASKKL